MVFDFHDRGWNIEIGFSECIEDFRHDYSSDIGNVELGFIGKNPEKYFQVDGTGSKVFYRNKWILSGTPPLIEAGNSFEYNIDGFVHISRIIQANHKRIPKIPIQGKVDDRILNDDGIGNKNILSIIGVDQGFS